MNNSPLDSPSRHRRSSVWFPCSLSSRTIREQSPNETVSNKRGVSWRKWPRTGYPEEDRGRPVSVVRVADPVEIAEPPVEIAVPRSENPRPKLPPIPCFLLPLLHLCQASAHEAGLSLPNHQGAHVAPRLALNAIDLPVNCPMYLPIVQCLDPLCMAPRFRHANEQRA